MQGRSLDTTLGVSWARVWSAMPLQMPVSLGEAGALRSRFTNVARRVVAGRSMLMPCHAVRGRAGPVIRPRATPGYAQRAPETRRRLWAR
jgi:hypothetical protein